MKAILIGAATIAMTALPVAALAATYQYVNTQGNLETETAANATQALTQPTDIAPHSGVLLVTNTVINTPNPANNGVTGTYSDVLTGINTQARTIYLTLLPNGSVIMSSIYDNGNGSTGPLIESGTWTGSGNNQVQVTLTGDQNGSYNSPQMLTFNVNGTNLSATNFNSSIYGTQGLTFTK